MRTLALAVGLWSVALADHPLRYRFETGDSFVLTGEFRSTTISRRGASTEKLAFTRAGTQRVTVCSRDGARFLLAVETDHAAARATAFAVNGKDRLAADAERVRQALPGPDAELAFLALDELGAGAPPPRDADLADAVLRVLAEVEVLPPEAQGRWERKGETGPVAWTGTFDRKAEGVEAFFVMKPREARGGATLSFETGRASLRLKDGRPEEITGSAGWSVAGEGGSESRELAYTLKASGGKRLTDEDARDAASDAAPLAGAEAAWRDGERDRALELWEKVATDPANRWAARAGERAARLKRAWPMLGKAAGEWAAPVWIGRKPEKGRWLAVYFWATWVPQCEGDLAAIAGLAREGLEIAGVTMVDALQTEDAVRQAVGRLKLPFGVALDDGSAAKAFKVEDVPRVYVVDPEGRVRFEGRGNERETLKVALERWVPE